MPRRAAAPATATAAAAAAVVRTPSKAAPPKASAKAAAKAAAKALASTKSSTEAPATPAPAAQEPSGLEAWERRLWGEGVTIVAGTDEAGRGPLAGPVVAAAFAILVPEDQEVLELLSRVADSKQMTALQREEAFRSLTDPRFEGRTVWSIAEASVEEIDEMNILRASLCAMARAVQGLKARPDCVLVDGCNRPPDLLAPGEQWTRGSKKEAEALKNQQKLSRWFTSSQIAKPVDTEAPWRPRRVEAVIEGDAKVPSISAASILAKVHRDRVMEALHEKFPVYGFQSHKGYGTEIHLEAIRAHGVCEHHRKSFGPIKAILGLGDVPAADDSQEATTEPQASDAKLAPVEDKLQRRRPEKRGVEHISPPAAGETPPSSRGEDADGTPPKLQRTASQLSAQSSEVHLDGKSMAITAPKGGGKSEPRRLRGQAAGC